MDDASADQPADSASAADAAGISPRFARYARQMRFAGIGQAGQERLAGSRAVIIGCGALGSAHANLLARAGVGSLRVVDRDVVEWTNLQRQTLFNEEDAAAGLPKVIAARAQLRGINRDVNVDARVIDVQPGNIGELLDGADVILDGTDNFETRFLINDASLFYGIPWIYGGCLGADGQTMTILPGESPCLRCVMPEPPPPGAAPTCDAAGILATIIQVIAAIQVNEALKILAGRREAVSRGMQVFDLWENRTRCLRLDALSRDCDACQRREFPWLNGSRASHSAVLCGRNAVQLSGPAAEVSLPALAERLAPLGEVRLTPYLLRFLAEERQITIFPDGRAIVSGTEDIAEAKTLYARYVGT